MQIARRLDTRKNPFNERHGRFPAVPERFQAKRALGLGPRVDTGSRKENASK
jgi:hypothetical protein